MLSLDLHLVVLQRAHMSRSFAKINFFACTKIISVGYQFHSNTSTSKHCLMICTERQQPKVQMEIIWLKRELKCCFCVQDGKIWTEHKIDGLTRATHIWQIFNYKHTKDKIIILFWVRWSRLPVHCCRNFIPILKMLSDGVDLLLTLDSGNCIDASKSFKVGG